MILWPLSPGNDNRPPECCWCGHEICDEADEVWNGLEVYHHRCAETALRVERETAEENATQEAAE